MTEIQTVDDAADREYMRSRFDATLFVEAGAGTGKTTEVVNRIVALISHGITTIEKIVAITFTEAAAAELRARVREGLDAEVLAESTSPSGRTRCTQALDNLDSAAISTIHSFCGALLRTFPLEAGLPPSFDTLDEIEQQFEFATAFRSWFENLNGDSPYGPECRRMLLLGLDPKNLATLAAELTAAYELLTPNSRWNCPPPADALFTAHRLGLDIRRLEPLVTSENEDHGFAKALRGAAFTAEQLTSARDEDEALAALQLAEALPHVDGDANQWIGSKEGAKLIKAGLRNVCTDAKELMTSYRQAALCALLPGLRDFVLEAVTHRKRRGVATFADLLVWARDLLRDNAAGRRRAQERWTHVFVDEFQDTDPLQAEIAFFLCAVPGSSLPIHWWDSTLVPGKLCVVGDPKQSIYRFRRADIGVYEMVQNAAIKSGGQLLHLRRNFRSQDDILGFINSHFSVYMKREPGLQPEYVALLPSRDDPGDHVWVMGEELHGKQPEVWAKEAQDVARAIEKIENGWTVYDHGEARLARKRDICVLIPTRTNIRRLERAFEDAGIPYRLESGALILATQEVRELLACLRAIDDPSDAVALVAALRSPTYGCSDADLLRWAESAGHFDYTRKQPEVDGPVAAAFDDLKARHRRRNQMTVPALVQQFLDERLQTVAVFAEPRPRESWRRQRWVVDRARAFEATEYPSLRAFLEWMEGLERESYRDAVGAGGELDEDAVRVMTVHGSKGLEFPIVILTGLGSTLQFRTPCVLPDRANNCLQIKVKGASTARSFATPGQEQVSISEKSLSHAEAVRLTYVGATRARDHLILSIYCKAPGNGRAAGDTFAHDFAQTFAGVDGVRRLVFDALLSAVQQAEPAETLPSIAEHIRNEEIWLEKRRVTLDAHTSLPLQTATGLAHESEGEAAADVSVYRAGRSGTSVGRAVHGVLQSIDLRSLTNLDELASVQASAEGVPGKSGRVAELVRAAQESRPVQGAIASGSYWREVPAGCRMDGMILEGIIDLLYEDPAGLVVVDYKTDDVSGAELRSRLEGYAVQGAAYREMVHRVTGRGVTRVDFVFVAAGEVHSFGGAELDGRLSSALASQPDNG